MKGLKTFTLTVRMPISMNVLNKTMLPIINVDQMPPKDSTLHRERPEKDLEDLEVRTVDQHPSALCDRWTLTRVYVLQLELISQRCNTHMGRCV